MGRPRHKKVREWQLPLKSRILKISQHLTKDANVWLELLPLLVFGPNINFAIITVNTKCVKWQLPLKIENCKNLPKSHKICTSMTLVVATSRFWAKNQFCDNYGKKKCAKWQLPLKMENSKNLPKSPKRNLGSSNSKKNPFRCWCSL